MSARPGTFYDKAGDRWYRDPRNPTNSWTGVSAVLGSRRVAYLEKAKLNGVVNYAARNRKTLAGMTQAASIALLREQDVVLPDWQIAREYGNRVHQVLENLMTGRPVGEGVEHLEGTRTYPVVNDFTEWVPRWWDQFVREYRPEILAVEQTVVSDRWGFAGSFDYLIKLDGAVTIVDGKSNKAGPKPDTALQNKAYSKADYILDMSTGRQSELPVIERSAVLWMRREGWNLFPLRFDEEVWRRFFARLITYQSADDEHTMIGEPLFDGPDAIEPRRWG